MGLRTFPGEELSRRMGSMDVGPLSPGTRQRLLQGQAGSLPAPSSSSAVVIFISSTISDMDTEREALQCTAYPEVQSFCQRHGLAFEVVDLRWGIPNTQATDYLTTELCLEELERCQKTSIGPAFVALLGDQYGPCPVPRRIEEKEWEALRAQLTSRPRDLELVTRHFQRDDNTIPPTYVLQPSGSLVVPGPEEATLTSVLRGGAQEAWRLGLISQEQWMCYHRSVIEWEIELGLLNSARGDQGATVFLRDVQDLNKHILDDCSLKMVDRLADGCLDTNAQSLLSGLKGRILDAQPGALKSHHLSWSRDLVNPKNKAHARYLKQLSEQFVARTNHQVLEQLRELELARQELGWLYQEIRHHLWQSTESTKVFCGHQELLAQLRQRLRQDESRTHTPLVLFGPPGIGKTSLMCKLAQQVPELLGHKTVVVLRLLGTSKLSLDARSLLRSLSFQVCLAYGLPLPPAQVLEAHSRVGHFFHTLLHTVSRRNFESLVLLLDSVDDLDSICHSPRVSWLPLKCPPRVHLILSTCSGQQVLHNLQQTLKDPSTYWEVKALSGSQGQEFIQLLLAAERRMLSPGQRDVLWASLPECGHPGRLRLAFEEARKWASFTVPVPLATTAEEATHQLCIRLEETHGALLVAHVLGYIVSSRYGLSEAELKDVLSLDDEVLQAVYRDWTPPSKELLRFPPLLWVRLRRDLGHCLVRRPVDGCMLLAIAHRQLSQVIQVRYLSGPERAKRHGVLAEFFSGAWSQGIKKLITLPLVGKPLNLDRKVAPQPLWFSSTVANLRKLTELPFHLLHAGRLEELKQEVLGNMSWISCRGISGGIEVLLDDFDMCAPHMDSPEVDLVREAIQLCGPAVELRGLEKSVLYTELLARLLFFAASHPAMIGQLCQQAQSWFRACPYPMLVPLAGFLQPPGGPLRATLTGCHKGITAIAWSLEEKLLVVGTQDGAMVVWDVEEQQVVHVLMGHTAEVKCVRVFAQGTLAISASKDHTLRLWSLLSGQEKVTILDGGSQNPTEPQSWDLHVDERNNVVYSTSGARINMWNLETSKLVFCITGDVSDPWVCVALLAAQGLLLALSKGGQVSLWSSAMGKLQEKHQLSSIKEETPTCAVSIQSRARLVAGFSSGSIALVSAGEDRLLEKLPEAVGFLVVSEDDSLLVAGEEQDCLDTSNEVRCLEVAEQAKLLFTGLVSGIVLVFPLNSRQDVLCIPPPEARKAVNCMSLSKSENRLAIAYDNIVLVLDISPGDPCPAIEGPTYTFYTQLPETIVSVAVLADYRVVYGMSDGSLFLYDCACSKVFPLEAHGSRVSCVEVSHSEQLAVSGAEDALLCLWDLQACRGMFEMSYENSCCRGVRCACFSRDDKHVFAGMEDRSVTAWSTVDGTLLAVQFVHAVINRIIPTSNGFMAPTSHGYLIRERFQCPSVRASQQDPLKNFKKAVWLVKTRQREELAAAEASQDAEPVAVEGKESKSNKRSQVCLIL
uniref:NACHT and WD repeat domain containing 1 n=1 Tax=Mus spicilegus TaxID=10103 RepID=A0A8C6N301_MUSSI